MHPGRETRSTPTATTPAPRTSAAPTGPARGSDPRRALRHLPFAAQAERLAPTSMSAGAPARPSPGLQAEVAARAATAPGATASAAGSAMTLTPAMVGLPVESSLAAIQAAHAELASEAAPRDLGPDIDRVRGLEGQAAERVGQYAATVKGDSADLYRAEAEADYPRYRTAEADASTAAATWRGAVGVGRVAETSYQATVRALGAQGLASLGPRDRPEGLDAAAVAAESGAYAADLEASHQTIAAPRLDDGGVGTALLELRAAAQDANAATLGQRSRLDAKKADDDEAALGDASSAFAIVGQVLSFVGDVSSAIAAPSAASVGAVAMDVCAIAGGALDARRTALLAQIATCRRLAKDDAIVAGWSDVEAALTRLEAARRGAAEATRRLQDESRALTAGLANQGVAMDDRARAAGTLAPGDESRAALGRHLGQVLEAQRLTAAARDAFATCADPLASAAEHADQATSDHRASVFLADVQDRAAPAGPFFHRLGGLRGALDDLYAQRLASLAPAVGQIARDLGRRSEEGAR